MSELVLMHHEQPMTTSLAIAEGVESKHENVIKLVRKYVDDLSEWGRVGFEIQPFDTDGGKQWRELAYLNEPQATLLLTFMRNSPIVIEFKKALVRAFFELRDQAAPQKASPLNMSHVADITVAADRTFRSWMRTSRALGMPKAKAVRLANEKTKLATGIDVLAEAGYQDTEDKHVSMPVRFITSWLAGELDLPVICCASRDLYQAFVQWCKRQAEPWPAAHNVFSRDIKFMHGIKNVRKGVRKDDGRIGIVAVIMPDCDTPDAGVHVADWLALRLPEFAEAVKDDCS